MDALGDRLALMLAVFRCSVCEYTNEGVLPVPCKCAVMCGACKQGSRLDDFSTEDVFTCRHCTESYSVGSDANASSLDIAGVRNMIVALATDAPAKCRFCGESVDNVLGLDGHFRDKCVKIPRVCSVPACGAVVPCGEVGHACNVLLRDVYDRFIRWVAARRLAVVAFGPKLLYGGRYLEIDAPLEAPAEEARVEVKYSWRGVVPSFVKRVVASSCVKWRPDVCWWCTMPEESGASVACGICCAIRPLVLGYDCQMDHPLCGECSQRCSVCPICRAPPRPSAPERAQTLAALPMVCPCGVVVPYGDAALHACEHGGAALCPFCDWIGLAGDYAGHCNASHARRVWTTFVQDQMVEASGGWGLPIGETRLRNSVEIATSQ
jgi:hypothetical protein